MGDERTPMVSSWISPKARKGVSSDIAGRGLFAVEPISAGEIVAVKGGHIVTTRQLDELPEPLPNSEIQIADDLHLVALSPDEYEPVMLFINHACDPNVGSPATSCLCRCAMSLRVKSSPRTTRCSTTPTTRWSAIATPLTVGE